jgi:hypothetical protein
MTENPRVGGSIPSQATINIEEKATSTVAFSILCAICVPKF